MKTVLFSITSLDRLPDVMGAIWRVLRPMAVEPLYPGTGTPDLKRDFFVAVDDKRDLNEVAQHLLAVPGVEDVDVPVPRKLIA